MIGLRSSAMSKPKLLSRIARKRIRDTLKYRALATPEGCTIEDLCDHADAMDEVLRKLAQGKGRYSRDYHQHLENCIEDMKALANKALAATGDGGGEVDSGS